MGSWVAPLVGAQVIFQAFNMTFDQVAHFVPKLAAQGYTHVQISPPQKSIEEKAWWGRYQPVDYSKIEGPLGGERQLRRLVNLAHASGMKVIVDAVLNHMASPEHFPDLKYPQFDPRDFHYAEKRPCIANWNDRFEVTHFWLCAGNSVEISEGKLPDLDTTSPKVREIHREYLQRLLDLGVDGFRFDAAKHIETEYFQYLLPKLKGAPSVYGEVIGSSVSETRAYAELMPVTDFHLLADLIDVFRAAGDLRALLRLRMSLPSQRSVVFARNHDTAMNKKFFNFESYQEAMLANAFLLGLGFGIPMVYRGDADQAAIRAGVTFFKALSGKRVRPRMLDDRDVFAIERGDSGLAVLNKSMSWKHFPRFEVLNLRPGIYKELQYGFEVRVVEDERGKKWIVDWDVERQRGLHIGPMTALFLLGK